MIVGHRYITGYEVYRSEEFKVFCKRFGIAHELLTKDVTIVIKEDTFEIIQKYRPSENLSVINTTTEKGPTPDDDRAKWAKVELVHEKTTDAGTKAPAFETQGIKICDWFKRLGEALSNEETAKKIWEADREDDLVPCLMKLRSICSKAGFDLHFKPYPDPPRTRIWDTAGKPIVNSAGEPFQPPVEVESCLS